MLIAPPALPLQDHTDLHGIPVDVQDHFIKQAGEQTLAVPRRCPLSLPQRRKIPAERRKSLRIRRPGLFGLGHLKLLLRALQRLQRLFPLPFQRRRNQAVVGINLPITARRKVSDYFSPCFRCFAECTIFWEGICFPGGCHAWSWRWFCCLRCVASG